MRLDASLQIFSSSANVFVFVHLGYIHLVDNDLGWVSRGPNCVRQIKDRTRYELSLPYCPGTSTFGVVRVKNTPRLIILGDLYCRAPKITVRGCCLGYVPSHYALFHLMEMSHILLTKISRCVEQGEENPNFLFVFFFLLLPDVRWPLSFDSPVISLGGGGRGPGEKEYDRCPAARRGTLILEIDIT